MVPNGWKKMSLSTVAEIRTGVAKGKQNLKNPVELPYLRVANVQDGHIDISNIKTIQIEKGQIERYSLKAGDVLMTEGGDFDKLGRGDVWNGEISPCLHQNHVFAVRTDTSKLSPHFLAALSASRYGKSYFLGCSKRSTNLASINSTQLKEFPVLVPPLAEQNKITQILSTWDKAIATSEQLLANSQQQKKILMQQLLSGKVRFSGFSEQWQHVQVADVCKIGRGRVISKTEIQNYPGIYPVYSSQTFNNGIMGSINTYDFEGEYVTWTTDGANAGTVFYRTDKFNCTNVCGVLKPQSPELQTKYLALALSQVAFKYVSHTLANPKLMNGVMGNVRFQFPSFLEQQKIAQVITTADYEIKTLQQKLACLKQEKKALMQQLLTGKRRVKVDES